MWSFTIGSEDTKIYYTLAALLSSIFAEECQQKLALNTWQNILPNTSVSMQ